MLENEHKNPTINRFHSATKVIGCTDYEQNPLNIVGCSVVTKAGWTDVQTYGQRDGAGHDNTLQPEWAKGNKNCEQYIHFYTYYCSLLIKIESQAIFPACISAWCKQWWQIATQSSTKWPSNLMEASVNTDTHHSQLSYWALNSPAWINNQMTWKMWLHCWSLKWISNFIPLAIYGKCVLLKSNS